MESVEKSDKIFGAGNVLMDEDAVEQARADLAKATSPETIRCLLSFSPPPSPKYSPTLVFISMEYKETQEYLVI